MDFRVFEDDEESHVSEEANMCKASCGRLTRLGLNRMLRPYDTCCRDCETTGGIRHSADCGKPHESNTARHPLQSSNSSPRAELVATRLARVIESLPDPGMELDSVNAKAILDTLCASNELPCLDDKRFLLLFSRFSVRGKVPISSGKKFLYVALRRIQKAVSFGIENLPIPRYFFVFKKTSIEKHYRFRSILGQGSFGVVHRVIHLSSGQVRVCKSIAKKTSSIPAHQLESEIRIIAELDHPNVIRMHEFFEDDEYIHIIMEYCTGGDVLTMIKNSIKAKSAIPVENVRVILHQILRAVAFMSARRVIHKDLKPENIMLVPSRSKTGPPIVKIIDFGLSELFAENQHTSNMVAGTAFYMAPEIFRPPFNHKCDVWSCGVIAFFLATGFLPFFGATVPEVKSNVLYRRLQWPATFAGTDKPLVVAPEFRAFIERVLEKDPNLRPSAVEALADPWIRESKHEATISRAIALNMLSFSKLSLLKRAVINLIAHVWHFEEFENIIEMFSALDSGNDGLVSVSSLASAIEKRGFTSIDAWSAARSLDLSRSGFITYTAFTAGLILPLIDSDKGILLCAFNSFNPIHKDVVAVTSIFDVLSGKRCVVSRPSHPVKQDDFETFLEMVRNEKHLRIVSLIDTKVPSPQQSFSSDPGRLVVSFSDFRDWLLTVS